MGKKNCHPKYKFVKTHNDECDNDEVEADFEVYNTTPTVLNTTTPTLLPFNTVVYDDASAFNSVNSSYVIPFKGIYHFDFESVFTVAIGTAVVSVLYSLYVNGVPTVPPHVYAYGFTNSPTGGVNTDTAVISADLSLKVGDVVQIFAQGSASNVTTSVAGYNFDGHLVAIAPSTV